MSDNPYNNSEGRNLYVKTEYNGIISMRNPETGKMESVETTRTVYCNREVDPDLVIPAGTKIGNEKVTEKDTTNLERMQAGKSPVVMDIDENGKVTYDKIELHHLTGEEIHKGGEYFNGEARDGTIVEIRASKHDEYSRQLHNVNERNSSFRTQIVETVDDNGSTVRSRERTEEAVHYDRFRESYWIDRSDEFLSKQDNMQEEAVIEEKDDVSLITESDKNAVSSNLNDYVDVESTDNAMSVDSANDYVNVQTNASNYEIESEDNSYVEGTSASNTVVVGEESGIEDNTNSMD